MLNVIKNYGGALFFYFVLFFGVLAICTKINSLNDKKELEVRTELAIIQVE